MNIFVSGGAGYIGSTYVEQALNAGHAVTVYDSLVEGHRSAIDPRANFVQADLSDGARILEALKAAKAEVIVHFAAFALVGESMQNPGKYFGNNVGNGVKLLDAAVAAGVRKFVFSSTCATYGFPDQMPMTEETPQHGLEFVAFRYFNAAGASGRFGEHHRIETHLIPNVLKVALGQANQCEIYGTDYPTPDGTCVRDYIHIVDLAQAHLLAMEPGRQGFYNLGNGDGYSVREVIQMCEKVTGKKITAIEKPRRPGDPPRLVAAADKARRELGWQPKFPKLEQIVSTAWEWHRQHPNGYVD